jgi:hypothetical protein
MTDPVSGRPFIEGAGLHEPPPGSDWEAHLAGLDCLEFIEGTARGAGRIVPAPVAPEAPRPASDSRVVAPTASLLGRGPGPEASACAECSRVVVEAPSPVRALAWLIRTNAHRLHRPSYADDLTF